MIYLFDMDIYDFYITPDEYDKAAENGITYHDVWRRVYDLGWHKSRAITEPIRKWDKENGKLVKKAKENGIKKSTYYQRVKRGMDPEIAATKKTMQQKDVAKRTIHKVNCRKYPDWVYDNLKKYNINSSTFWHRVNTHGWDLEKASTTPPVKTNLKV